MMHHTGLPLKLEVLHYGYLYNMLIIIMIVVNFIFTETFKPVNHLSFTCAMQCIYVAMYIKQLS